MSLTTESFIRLRTEYQPRLHVRPYKQIGNLYGLPIPRWQVYIRADAALDCVPWTMAMAATWDEGRNRRWPLKGVWAMTRKMAIFCFAFCPYEYDYVSVLRIWMLGTILMPESSSGWVLVLLECVPSSGSQSGGHIINSATHRRPHSVPLART